MRSFTAAVALSLLVAGSVAMAFPFHPSGPPGTCCPTAKDQSRLPSVPEGQRLYPRLVKTESYRLDPAVSAEAKAAQARAAKPANKPKTKRGKKRKARR